MHHRLRSSFALKRGCAIEWNVVASRSNRVSQTDQFQLQQQISMLRVVQGQLRRCISTELIKKNVERKLTEGKSGQVPEYPRTFEQKIVFLNDPKTIQKLQIIEYGVKYKPGKKYITLILFLAGLFFYYNEQYLPVKIVDSYFCISNSSDLQHPSGFVLAPFMYELPFFLYSPLLLAVNQMSKFISNRWVLAFLAANALVSGAIGKYLVDQRVQQYEVWDQERISYGQGTAMGLSAMLWGALGPLGGFTALKARVMLKSVPGLGITQAGIPIGYICLFYMLFEAYCWREKGKKNSQAVLSSALMGFLFGMLVRRFSPLK